MIKRWFEPVLCFVIALIAFISAIESFATDWGSLSSIGSVYGQAFLIFGLITVIGAIVLMKYRKVGVPILIANGIWMVSCLFHLLDLPFFVLLIICLKPPYALPFWLIVIAIIAWIRKPLQKEKLEEIKKKLE